MFANESFLNIKFQKPFFLIFKKNNTQFEGTDFYGRCRGASPFPTRKCTPEPVFCFRKLVSYLL